MFRLAIFPTAAIPKGQGNSFLTVKHSSTFLQKGTNSLEDENNVCVG